MSDDKKVPITHNPTNHNRFFGIDEAMGPDKTVFVELRPCDFDATLYMRGSMMGKSKISFVSLGHQTGRSDRAVKVLAVDEFDQLAINAERIAAAQYFSVIDNEPAYQKLLEQANDRVREALALPPNVDDVAQRQACALEADAIANHIQELIGDSVPETPKQIVVLPEYMDSIEDAALRPVDNVCTKLERKGTHPSGYNDKPPRNRHERRRARSLALKGNHR